MADGTAEEAGAWVAKASDDLFVASLIARNRGPSTVGCYLCQQAIEKLLKALILEAGDSTPRTHDLVDLHRRLGERGADLGLSTGELRGWTAYATAARYPGFPDPQSDVDLPRMIECATDLMARVRQRLGVPG